MIGLCLLFGSALASNDPEVDQTITVYAEKDSDRIMRQIHRKLRKMGYKAAILKDGKTIFEPIVQWKPTLILGDDGLVTIKRSRPRFEPWVGGAKDNRWRYLSCLPPFTPMCIQMQSWLMDKRKFFADKSRLIAETEAPISRWQTAIASEAHEERIGQLLPDELSQMWKSEEKNSAADRILSMWIDRTCTPEGEQARMVIGDFIIGTIQNSPYAIAPKRLQAAEEKSSCKGQTRLDKTEVIE